MTKTVRREEMKVTFSSWKRLGATSPEKPKKPKEHQSGALRVQRYRERLKHNATKYEEQKEKKKKQNQVYKGNLKMKRKMDSSFNRKYLEQQRQWKQKSRKKQNKRSQKKPEELKEAKRKMKSPADRPAAFGKDVNALSKTCHLLPRSGPTLFAT